jgi:hypothetical protein
MYNNNTASFWVRLWNVDSFFVGELKLQMFQNKLLRKVLRTKEDASVSDLEYYIKRNFFIYMSLRKWNPRGYDSLVCNFDEEAGNANRNNTKFDNVIKMDLREIGF